jgi:hypothetical protein
MISALFAVLLAVGIAALAYQAGVSHGLALHVPAEGAAPPVAVWPYYWYRPWGFGFGPILFFILLWIVLSRAFFWRGRARWHRAYWVEGPPHFDEWHRRAHERMNNPNTPPSTPINA